MQSSQDSYANDFSYVSSPKNSLVVWYDHPRDGDPLDYDGLCRPHKDKSGSLRYNPYANFSNEDYDAVIIPAKIPDITNINGPEDICKIAKFFANYVNGTFTKPFMESQNVMNRVVYKHFYAFLQESNRLLDLVHPSKKGESNSVRERLKSRIEIALPSLDLNNSGLILALCEEKKSYPYVSFCHFDKQYSSWEGIYAPNKDQIDAAMRFARMVYVDKPDIQAFATTEELNAALMEIDPEFRAVVP